MRLSKTCRLEPLYLKRTTLKRFHSKITSRKLSSKNNYSNYMLGFYIYIFWNVHRFSRHRYVYQRQKNKYIFIFNYSKQVANTRLRCATFIVVVDSKSRYFWWFLHRLKASAILADPYTRFAKGTERNRYTEDQFS